MRIEQPRRIAIFRALQLGDLLAAVPAIRAIRRRFPEAEISLIGLPWAATFAQRFARYIDRFIEFPGYPGIDEAPFEAARTTRFLEEQRSYGYDLVVQMHGSGQTSNPFVLALHGKHTVGYYQGKRPAGLTLAAEYPHEQHEILRNLGLVALLDECRGGACPRPALRNLGLAALLDECRGGACSRPALRNLGLVALLDGWEDKRRGGACPRPIEDTTLEFPLYGEDYAEAARLLALLPTGRRPWIGMHVGARPPARRWPLEHFAALADALVRTFNAEVLLTGSADEKTMVRSVLERMETRAVNLAGKTSLGGLAALMRKLDLFISNDTGPAHLAVAVDCPSVTIFGPADPQRWAPLDRGRHPIARREVACSPCGYWQCPIDHRCLRWLSPAMVMDAAEGLLREGVVARREQDRLLNIPLHKEK